MKICCFLLVILFASGATAQEVPPVKEVLSQTWLNTLEDEELLTQFDHYHGDSTAQEKIARTYLDRARRQGDTIKMARGYDRLAQIFHREKNIRFSDSIIELTQDLNHITYPGLAYIHKSRNVTSEIDVLRNLLIAYDYARKRENEYHKLFILSILFTQKNDWGNTHEAKKIAKNTQIILSNPNIVSKLKSSFRNPKQTDYEAIEEFYYFKFYNEVDLLDAHLTLKELDSARQKLKDVFSIFPKIMSSRRQNFQNLIKLKEIQLYYLQGDFDIVIIETDSILKKQNIDKAHLIDTYFHRSNAFMNLGEKEKGLISYKIADSIASVHDLLPKHRPMYDSLIKYSENSGNNDLALKYLKKVREIDREFAKNYKAIGPSIIKNIETPALLAEKEEQIKSLEYQNAKPNPWLWVVWSLFSTSLLFLWYYRHRQTVYRKRFLQLQERLEAPTKVRSLQEASARTELSPEVIETILAQLEHFEQRKQFTNPEVSLRYLAKKFNTNTNYLSRVINLKMGKNFSQYLNELRIQFVLKELNQNPLIRKYAIKALAEECGYTNTVSFSRAFYAKTGIKPSYYIENLKKSTA